MINAMESNSIVFPCSVSNDCEMSEVFDIISVHHNIHPREKSIVQNPFAVRHVRQQKDNACFVLMTSIHKNNFS